jgi:hypothetical protein
MERYVSDNDKKKLNPDRNQVNLPPGRGGIQIDDSYLFDYIEKNSDEEEGGSSAGGQAGEIEFRYHDAMSVAKRDDLLPPNEIKRLLIVQKDLNKIRVDGARDERAARAARKKGEYVVPTVAQQLGRGGSGGGSSPHKKHPISDKAQFSGDKKVIGIPSATNAKTNEDQKDQLENKNELKNRYQNTPKFNPRPRPPGS